MKCPKCQSENIYQLKENCVCRNCENVFTSDIPLKPQAKTPVIKQSTSFVTKITKKQYGIASIVIILAIGGLTALILSKRDPYICSKRQREKVTTQFSPIVQNWEDVEKLASSTSRINLSIPVNELQKIQQQARGVEFPKCAETVKNQFLSMTETTIDSYLSFMRDDPDSVVSEKMDIARGGWLNFLNYYSRLQNGESTDPIKISQADLEKNRQLIQDSQKVLKEFNKNNK